MNLENDKSVILDPISILREGNLKTDDLYAFGIIQQLLDDNYIPFLRSALRPFCLANILNDLVINQRSQVIEFGSGISTILFARLIKCAGLNTRIISIEDNVEWKKLMEEKLLAEGLDKIVNIIYAPLEPCELGLNGNLWYDTQVLDEVLLDRQFDSVIVDGPAAWEPTKGQSRYPALIYMIDKLKSKAIIFLDDAEREGEASIISMWEKQLDLQFRIIGGTLAYAIFGENNFDFEIV